MAARWVGLCCVLALWVVAWGDLTLDPGTNVYSEKIDIFDLGPVENRTIAVTLKSFFNLRFMDHPYLGYEWQLKNRNSLKLLAYSGEGNYYPSGQGKPSKRHFAFQAIAPGQEDIILLNMQDDKLETARQYIVTVYIH